MKNFRILYFTLLLAAASLLCSSNLMAQGEVTRSGSTWSARVNGSTVYTGSRMFDAVNAACNNMGAGTINIRNSGDSGPDGGSVYAIRPQANQTLDFHGHAVNCNGGDLVVAVHADRRDGITVRNLHVTGNPRYGIWFRGCSDVTLTNITMNLSNNSPVGLGIRVDNSTRAAYNLTINGTIDINGSAGHAVETYGIDGFSIGDVTANNTGGCGLLLNNSRNGTVGVVTGTYNNQGGGYATFRVANNNGPNVSVEGVYSRNSGRGFFSVSGSHGTTIGWVDIANSSSHGIFLEDASNTHVQSGTVSNGNPNCQEVRTTSSTINVAGCGGSGGSGGSGSSYYQLRNRGTGLLLDGMGLTTNGSAVGQYGNTTHVNSQWEMVPAGSYYQLRNRGTGLFLDGMGHTANGEDVGQWASTTHVNSQWSVQQYSGNYYRIQNRGTGLYIDGMGRTSNGSAAGQWGNTTHVNAQWELILVSGSGIASSKRNEELQVAEKAGRVKVYPNPASDVLTISLPAESENGAVVKLIDVAGKEVLQSSFKGAGTDLNVQSLSSGFYVLIIEDGANVIKQKVIIE